MAKMVAPRYAALFPPLCGWRRESLQDVLPWAGRSRREQPEEKAYTLSFDGLVLRKWCGPQREAGEAGGQAPARFSGGSVGQPPHRLQ